MKVSIIVPVHNESKTVVAVLKKLNALKFDFEKEIIVVDDGSSDSSNRLIKNYIKNKKTFLLVEKKAEGKGSAVIKGIKYSKGDIIAIQDADWEYNIFDLKKLIDFVSEGELVVYGSRFLGGSPRFSIFYFGNVFLSFFTSLLYFRKISDMETCYKVFKKEVLEGITLKSKKFEIEPEITSKILKKGIKIKEVPVGYNPRKKLDGKKIGFSDGFSAFWYLLKYRFIN